MPTLQVKLLRQADRTLEVLEVDEAKFADELSTQQEEFAGSLKTLSTVSRQQPAVADHSFGCGACPDNHTQAPPTVHSASGPTGAVCWLLCRPSCPYKTSMTWPRSLRLLHKCQHWTSS